VGHIKNTKPLAHPRGSLRGGEIIVDVLPTVSVEMIRPRRLLSSPMTGPWKSAGYIVPEAHDEIGLHISCSKQPRREREFRFHIDCSRTFPTASLGSVRHAQICSRILGAFARE
jgi:hypothetical protein